MIFLLLNDKNRGLIISIIKDIEMFLFIKTFHIGYNVLKKGLIHVSSTDS